MNTLEIINNVNSRLTSLNEADGKALTNTVQRRKEAGTGRKPRHDKMTGKQKNIRRTTCPADTTCLK